MRFIFMSFLLVSQMLLSQVGINTEIPKATLDVVGDPTDITKVDGVIAPKIKGSELKNKDPLYQIPQTGVIIYVTEPLAETSTTEKTVNVTSVGYYYFDGNIWQKFITNTEPWHDVTTKTPATKNTQDIYQMGKIGIGTNNPGFNLEALGSIAFPSVVSNTVQGPYKSLGVNNVTGQVGTFSPGAAPTFIRRSIVEQIGIGSTAVLANIHSTNTNIINTIGITHNDNYLQIPESGIYRIDFSVTGRRDNVNSGSASSAALNLIVLVNDIEVTQDRIHYQEQFAVNVPSSISTIVNIQANDRLSFKYIVTFPTDGDPKFRLTRGNGASYSQQVIITKL